MGVSLVLISLALKHHLSDKSAVCKQVVWFPAGIYDRALKFSKSKSLYCLQK